MLRGCGICDFASGELARGTANEDLGVCGRGCGCVVGVGGWCGGNCGRGGMCMWGCGQRFVGGCGGRFVWGTRSHRSR